MIKIFKSSNLLIFTQGSFRKTPQTGFNYGEGLIRDKTAEGQGLRETGEKCNGKEDGWMMRAGRGGTEGSGVKQQRQKDVRNRLEKAGKSLSKRNR